MMGNRLREVLERERVKANWVCRALDIDRAQLSRFLAGRTNISLRKLEQIAQYLGYDIRLVKLRPSRKGGRKWEI
jgi:transcriptional regulator with XRE-family HTH domain